MKDVECRDLSAWRVTIPRLEPRNTDITGKACFVFIIQVGVVVDISPSYMLGIYRFREST